MDAEADLGDGMLGASISCRRRSASVSDDYSVQKTNDDATESKYVAVKHHYWADPFIELFYAATEGTHRRDPEISRGYWARTASIQSIAAQFLELAGPFAQIINLGAGYDTLYWRLRDAGHNFRRFVEVDFSSVTAKKLRLIQRPQKKPDLKSYFSQPATESQHSDLHAGDYHLLGADLRQPREFEAKLDAAELDRSQPTLVVAECVLVYMDEAQCNALLRELASRFDTVSFVNYEQVNMNDNFGKIMLDNLHNRGIALPGLPACENLHTQKERFLKNGWQTAHAWTMNEIYSKHLDRAEVGRIENIEPLDEGELLTQLLQHYCLVYASKDDSKAHANLANITSK
ncbi:leucine carboxyl methyltransferase [Aphelenchoides avenae]|nr:leucine carboxyl methyltransferase [Aphelenchus avenae]